MKTKKLFAGIAVTSMILGITVVIGCRDYGNIQAKGDMQNYSEDKIGVLNEYLEMGYLYDLTEITEKQMTDSIYQNFVYTLENPGTYYLNEEDLSRLKVVEQGNYIGTGLELVWEASGKSIIVTGIIEGSPASDNGVKVGDHVTNIAGIKVTGANQQEIMEKIAYAGEEPVQYTIKDSQSNEEREIEVVATEIKMPDISSELKQNIGYIKVESIRSGTSDNIYNELQEFEDTGAKGIILDLRDTHTNNLE